MAEIEKHTERIIQEIEEFYQLYYAFDVDTIIKKYKEPLIYDTGGTIEEMKNVLIELLHITEWTMTPLPKDYIRNKVLEAIEATDFEEDNYLMINTCPFSLFEEDNGLPIEFNYDIKILKLEIIVIS